MMLFHPANASLLPLVSQNLAHGQQPLGPLFMAGLLIVPQAIVTILAPWIGCWSGSGAASRCCSPVSRSRPCVRCVAFISDPWLIMAAQALDGITGAIITVLMIRSSPT